MSSNILEITGLEKYYPSRKGSIKVLDNIDLSVGEEFLSILGPSGCGKSTLLRIIAGVEKPDKGKIMFHIGREPRIGFVFQFPTLLPWMTVLDNITLPLIAMGAKPNDAREKALKVLSIVGLKELSDFYPSELSGGMKQRVNIARALVIDPDILLLDEPFSQLDPLTAEALRNEVIDLWISGITGIRAIIMVTHNLEEAILMSDRVVVFSPRPAKIIYDTLIPVPRPRTRKDPRIQELIDKVYEFMSR